MPGVPTTGAATMRSRWTTDAAAALALLAALLIACLAAPPAPAATSEAQIEALLEQYESPMAGTGDTFLLEGREHGVDPAFLVAVAGAETSFGRYLYAQGGDACTYNAFNWFYADTWPEADFVSWEDAIATLAEGIAGPLYHEDGLYSVWQIGPRYCPDGTDNWLRNVSQFMTRLGGDPHDTRLVDGPGPPGTAPELSLVDGRVRLSHGPYRAGGSVRVAFTVRNSGGAPITMSGVRLAVRGPGGRRCDLASAGTVTLQPGEARHYVGVCRLDLVGEWDGWLEIDFAGERNLIGPETAFRIRVSPPPGLQRQVRALREDRLGVTR